MDRDLDTLLSAQLLDVPVDFTQRVMGRIHLMPMPMPRPRPGWLDKLQALALIAGGILGATQLAAFMFGMWTASAAG
jgi:anti-sigma factor RsiW